MKKEAPSNKELETSSERCDSVAYTAKEIGRFWQNTARYYEEHNMPFKGVDLRGVLYSLEAIRQTFERPVPRSPRERGGVRERKPEEFLLEEVLPLAVLNYLEKVWGPGYEPYDIAVAYSAEAPEEERLAALERLPSSIGQRPIALRRWHALRSRILAAL